MKKIVTMKIKCMYTDREVASMFSNRRVFIVREYSRGCAILLRLIHGNTYTHIAGWI